MDLLPRPYQNETDLELMCALLREGLGQPSQPSQSFTIHPGDLNWWLYYFLDGQDPWANISLWEHPAVPGRLLGWGLVSTPWSAYDVFLHPGLWGSDEARQVDAWVEQRVLGSARRMGHEKVSRGNVAEGDTALCASLAERGFQPVRGDDMLLMGCPLDRTLPGTRLPDGYGLRTVDQEMDGESRAAAQHAAFQSGTPWEQYLPRYLRFMASPGYARGADWIVTAPGGRLASFCIAWPDGASRCGLVEPMGTHPEFQRLGLGRAVMLAGLQYLQGRGMRSARLCVRADNSPAIRLYESVGFQVQKRLLTYQKPV